MTIQVKNFRFRETFSRPYFPFNLLQCISQNFEGSFVTFVENFISSLRTWEFHYATVNQRASFETNLGKERKGKELYLSV